MNSHTSGDQKKVLILGASGYLGQHIALTFLKMGWQVVGLGTRVLNSSKNFEAWGEYTYLQGDITQAHVQQSAVDVLPDVVIFCIALDHESSEKNFSRALQLNVESLWRFLEKVGKSTSRPVKMIYLSSVQVYGELSGEVCEDHDLSPRNVYGLTHLLAERVLLAGAAQGYNSAVAVRVSNGYGPPVQPTSSCWPLVLNDFCRSAFREKKVRLKSDGKPCKDFIFVDDIANGVATLATNETDVKTVNFCSGRTYNLIDLAITVTEEFGKYFGEDIPILNADDIVIPKTRDAAVSPPFVFDVGLLQKLGIRMNTHIRSGIQLLFKSLERGSQ